MYSLTSTGRQKAARPVPATVYTSAASHQIRTNTGTRRISPSVTINLEEEEENKTGAKNKIKGNPKLTMLVGLKTAFYQFIKQILNLQACHGCSISL